MKAQDLLERTAASYRKNKSLGIISGRPFLAEGRLLSFTYERLLSRKPTLKHPTSAAATDPERTLNFYKAMFLKLLFLK